MGKRFHLKSDLVVLHGLPGILVNQTLNLFILFYKYIDIFVQ